MSNKTDFYKFGKSVAHTVAIFVIKCYNIKNNGVNIYSEGYYESLQFI